MALRWRADEQTQQAYEGHGQRAVQRAWPDQKGGLKELAYAAAMSDLVRQYRPTRTW